jgi:hypothetical protein
MPVRYNPQWGLGGCPVLRTQSPYVAGRLRWEGGRSEGTPHKARTSDFDPGLPYAVFLQNTLILWDVVPRAMPWAGMRCPFRAYGTMAFPMRYSLQRKRNDDGFEARVNLGLVNGRMKGYFSFSWFFVFNHPLL